MIRNDANIPHRPTHLQVDLAQIQHNLSVLQKMAPTARPMPILKANAYGHGLIPVARTLVQCGVADIGVAYLEEALMLRSLSILLITRSWPPA